MSRMIFVTGFARGGTTWLRNCIATHPDIGRIGSELVLFRDHVNDRPTMERIVAEKIQQQGLKTKYFVEKSPANAPFVDKAVKTLPDAKFVFIIRDPRDVFISHKRGTREWMGGSNSTVDGCLKKTQNYYGGYERAQGAPNLLLVRYEDLHQDFHATMKKIYEFIGVSADPQIIKTCYEENNFWAVASRHIERRDEAERKGVVGDWVIFLEEHEAKWIKNNRFWTQFMNAYGYSWDVVTYAGVLRALHDSGAKAMSEDDLLQMRLDPDRINVLLHHDIDMLDAGHSRESILDMANAEAQLGLPGIYCFLPMDDSRYRKSKPAKIAEFIRQLKEVHPLASIALHLNAAERFFPADAPESDDDDPAMPKAIAYLHEQVDEYAKHGINFRTATAHGYGRRKKRPNNRDSVVLTEELKKRGILLWDTVLRPALFERAREIVAIADVGGALAANGLLNPGSLTDPQTFRSLPAGSLIHMLAHPGNYDTRKPVPLGRRRNRLGSPGDEAAGSNANVDLRSVSS